MSDIATWLEQLGLARYAPIFSENEVELADLSELSEADLKEIGLPLGPRRRILKAVRALDAEDRVPTESTGNDAAGAHTHVEAERRQLTVMFCDLVGSTALSQRLDPEDLREVMRRYQDTLAGVVTRFEGHVAKFLGDGVLAFFGWPRAYEDQAERAVRSGLAAVKAVAKLEAEDGQTLEARVGIATGLVVIGDIVGEAATEADAVAGETPNLAARLQGVAAPGQVVIGTTTRLLIGETFDLEDLGRHELKGFVEPAQAWRVVRDGDIDGGKAARRVGAGLPLVGRQEELGLLLRSWEMTKESHGQVLLVQGEAGIGKSRLVEALRERILAEDCIWITVRCSPYHTNSTLYPVIEHLRRVLGWTPEDDAEAKLEKLEAALEGQSLPLTEAVPLYAELLSLPLPEERYAPLELSAKRKREQTLDGLSGWLLEEAERRPVLQVWEDLHWADPTTLELLTLYLEQSPTVSMMNVLTYRPEFVPPWTMRSHLTPITLNRLERPEVEALIGNQAHDKEVPPEVVEHIVEKTDGVPLYVEELTKSILGSDYLLEGVDRYSLTGSLSEVAIPATLQDSLMARLDRVSRVRELAQMGAVLGREFAYEMLQNLTPLEEPVLQDGLGQLVENEILYQRGRPPRSRYIFKHALIQDAAYQSLLKRTRQQYHQQVAALMEERFPETIAAQPELVAHHFAEAGCTEEAVAYYQTAGKIALRRSANVEAINQVSHALELLATLPKTLDWDRLEIDLRLALGAALIAPKSYSAEEVRLAFARAHELCQSVGDVEQRFQAVKGLWNCHVLRAELGAARNLAQELSILAQDSAGPDRLLMVHRVMTLTHLGLGEYRKSLEACERGIELHDPDRQATYLSLYGEDPGLFCYAYSIWTNHWLGHLDAASERAEQALELAKRLPSRYARSYVLALTANVFLWQRRLDAALECAHTAHEVAEEQSIPQWRAWADVVIGGALTKKGQLQEGLSRIAVGQEIIHTKLGRFIPIILAPTIAEAFYDCGEYAEGLKLLNEAESILPETGVEEGVSEICRLRGNFLAVSGAGPEQCEAAYREALVIARRQEAKTLELRAATDLARLWRTQGRNLEARDLLKPVYNWFTEGLDTPDLKDAKTQLDDVA